MTSCTIYTDGACSGNPGPGGWSAVLIWKDNIKEISGGEASTTNNRMELTAAIQALEAVKRPVKIELYSDSSYLVKGATLWLAGWKRNGWRRSSGRLENIDLWQQLDELITLRDVTWRLVKGHADNEMNNRADKLAVEAMKSRKVGT